MVPSNKRHCRLCTEFVAEPPRRQHFNDNNSLVDNIKLILRNALLARELAREEQQ
jgi:hypothetical protein